MGVAAPRVAATRLAAPKHAAKLHAATRHNILTSLNIRLRRLRALSRIFVVGRHNLRAPAYELIRTHFAEGIENSVHDLSRSREQFYRLSLDSLEQQAISAVK
jgi:hypothetical protein